MRRVLFLAVVAATGLLNAGCLLNAYPSDPARRTMVLINQSENLRQIEYEMERFWMVDQPSHLTPERVHGGVGQ
jgi:hypothetical protein